MEPLHCERILAILQTTQKGKEILDRLHRMFQTHDERCEWLFKPNKYFNNQLSPAKAVAQNRLDEVLGALDALETFCATCREIH